MKRLRSVAALVLSVLLIASLMGGVPSALADDFRADADVLVSDTATPLANGITQHEVVTNNESGTDQNIEYWCDIDLSQDNVSLVAGYGDNSADKWSLTRMTDQAKAYERDNPGETVVAAINADFFNMATGEPIGALVMNGEVKHAANGRYYFGVTKDGKAVIRNTEDLSDLQMAVGGSNLLVNDGVIASLPVDGFQDINYARCSIGIKPDGSVLTVTTHGNFAPTSCGRNNTEIAQMMVNAGCTRVLELDAGGSAAFASRAEGESALAVKSSPRDGAERQISSSILIVSNAEKTGVFDHVSLSPNNTVYTPGSNVQFEGTAVDTGGHAMDMPQGVTYQLADDSKNLGSINAQTGAFTGAEDQTGTATVQAVHNGNVVGSTSIELQKPDQIYFATEEANLGFEETSDLGIVVRWKQRDIVYKDGDLTWAVDNSDLGHFEGNLFIASDGSDLHGTVTAASKWDAAVKGQIKVNVGVQPTIVWNFEDKTAAADEFDQSAEDYYIGTPDQPGILSHSNYGRGGNESIDIVSIDDDEPVRFGEKSLKLNYDFTNCGEVTEGACIGTSQGMEIPGTPTGIGVWVYAPEGVGIEYQGDGTQAGFWLRGYVVDGAGNTQPYDFTLEPKHADVTSGAVQPGIYWEGWKYLEADLTHLAPPYKIPASMTLRLMYVAGTKMGTKSANSVYFDNLQFVYGANDDDIENPVIDSITYSPDMSGVLEGEDLTEGATFNTNTVNIRAKFHDVENKYTSGIDTTTTRLQLDGVNVLDNEEFESAYDTTANEVYLYNAKLDDGEHSITVSVRDEFGNETTETRHFIIDTGAKDQTKISVAAQGEGAVIGKTADLQIAANNGTVQSAQVGITLGNRFSEYEVTPSANYDVEATYSKMTHTVTINAERKADASADDGNAIATLAVKVPTNLKEGDTFPYTVKSGSFTTADGVLHTFSATQKTIPVIAPLQVSANRVVTGHDATITVTDAEGNPVEGADVYVSGQATSLGQTNAEGKLVTNQITGTAGNTVIYAQKGDERSFEFTVSVYDAQGDETGKPDAIQFNTVNNTATQKSISWLSSPVAEGKQVVKYAVQGTDKWTTTENVDTEQVYFTAGGNKTSIANSITLTGLKPNTTYEFQVGTEGALSEVRTFKTTENISTQHDFFVVGDIQSEDTTTLDTIIDQLSEGNYDFGIQTGDATDDPTLYDSWLPLANAFGSDELKGTGMIDVLGNHEFNGDANGELSAAIHGQPATTPGSCYSVKYGDLYVAVINYCSNTTQMEQAADWLKKDAAASHAKWRILATHQPPYYTNLSGGNSPVNKILTGAIEEAGIDAVFAGHDHSMARTNPMKGGEVDQDKGTVYYICASTGGKEYSISDPANYTDFDFNKTFALASIDYTAVYLTASVNDDEMTININDIDKGVVDSFTIKSKCHELTYNPDSQTVSCSRCGQTLKEYTGFANDAQGNSYYLLNGKLQTGWVQIGTDWHYFKANGIEEGVKVDEDNSRPTTCTWRGYTTYVSDSGATKRVDDDTVPGGHEFEVVNGKNVCSVCDRTQYDLSECTVTLSVTDCVYTLDENGNAVKRWPSVTVVDPEGRTLRLSENAEGPKQYYVTYKNATNIGTASIVLTPAKPGIYVDENEDRGDYSGEKTVNYTINPAAPTNVNMVNNGTSANLEWTASTAAKDYKVTYVIYRSDNGGAYKQVGTTTKTSYKATGLKSGTTYKFRVGSRVTVSGKNYDSPSNAVPNFLKRTITVGGNGNGRPVLTWNAMDGVSYQVWRSKTGKTGSFARIATTTKGTWTDTTGNVGTKYYYKVKAVESTMSVFSNMVTRTVVCEKPALKVTNRVDGKPVLTWNKVAGAVKYQAYRSASGKAGTFNWFWTGKSTTVTNVKNTLSGKTYYYKVRGLMANGVQGSLGDPVSIAVKAAVPTAKASTAAGYPTITWDKVPGASKYQIWRSTTGKVGSFRLLSTTTGLKYTNTSAKYNTTYWYRVRAVTSAGAKSAYGTIVSDKYTMATPTLSGSLNATKKLPVLSWNKVAGATKYKVYRSTSGKAGTFNWIWTGTGTKLTNTSATARNAYYYKVAPVSKTGVRGNLSNIVTFARDLTKLQPQLTITVRDDGKAKLNWNKVIGATQYQLWVSTTGDEDSYTKLFTGKTGTVFNHTSAEAGTTYYYKLKVVNASGKQSLFSAPVKITVE